MYQLRAHIRSIFHTVVQFLQNAVSFAIFLLLKNKSKPHQPPSPSSLLCVNTMSFGDVIISMELIRILSSSGKFSKIFFVVDGRFVDFINSLGLPVRVIPFNRKKYRFNFSERLRSLQLLHSLNAESAINLSQERGSVNDELTLLAGAMTTLTVERRNYFHIAFFDKLYTDQFTHIISSTSINEYEKNVDIWKYFHTDTCIPPPAYSLKLDNTRSTFVPASSYVVVAPFASDPERTWGDHRYRDLCQELSINNTGVLIGDSSQRHSLESIRDANFNIINLGGMTSLSDIPGILHTCILFIGNDSGLTHLALSLDVPVIALIGGGMYGRFFPKPHQKNVTYHFHPMECFNCRWNCSYKSRYCLTKISYSAVIKDVQFFLNRDRQEAPLQM
jgi:ADP-heptose:LPS heptosyltransferase